MVVKLSWGVTIQLVLILVAIGIAWGTITARLSALEVTVANGANGNTTVTRELADLSSRISKLEEQPRRRF
jgi:hypothetical protein